MVVCRQSVQAGWRGIARGGLLVALLIMALLAAGCGGFSADRAAAHESSAARPAPPQLGPGAFADFDARTFMPDRISIPAIKLDTPVVELGWSVTEDDSGRIFSEWDVAEYAAGWHKNSALPGEGGNVVLSGHNNILGSVFRELDQLEQGDLAVLFSGGARFNYRVDEVLIVPEKYATPQQRKDNAGWIAEFDDDRLTLVSCWPRDDNSHRIIVVAHRTDDTQLISGSK